MTYIDNPQFSADHELTDTEISQRYGAIVNNALDDFLDDPSYVVALIESATRKKARVEAVLNPDG